MTPSALKSWRASLGLNQAEAADALGVSRRTYEGWEAGREPQYPVALALACAAVVKRLKPFEMKTPPAG